MHQLSDNQRGLAPLVILILVVLAAFIFWELSFTLEREFKPSPSPSPKASNPACDFPDPNDPCDTDTGAGFNL